MDVEYTTMIGQLSMDNGKWRNDAPNQVAVREPKSEDAPGAGKGDLFIITEIQGNARNIEEMEQKLAQAVRDSYYLARGSITASLRRAIQTGSDLLYQRNRRVDVEDRVVGGAVVVVMSHEDAFLAQIGPTACYAVLGDHIHRYPARSIWLDEEVELGPDDDSLAMGLNAVVEPNLQHLRVTPEDMLLLADGRFASQMSLKQVVQALDSGELDTSLKQLTDMTPARQYSALLLKVFEEAPAAPERARAAAASQLSSLWPLRKPKDNAPQPEPETEPALAETVDEPQSKTAAIFANTATMLQRPLHWIGGLAGKDEPAEAAPDRVEEPAPRPQPPESHQPAISGVETTLRPEKTEEINQPNAYASYDASIANDEDSSGRGSAGQWLAGIFFGILAAVGSGIKNILGLITARAGDDEPRQAGAQAQPPGRVVSWKTLRIAAILIPILVAIVVGVSYLQKGQVQEAEYQEYLATAQTKFEQAQSVEPQAALALMAEAEAALIQAEQIKQEQPEIAALRQQMAEQTDSVTKIQRLYYLPQLRRYTDPGTALSSIVVQGVQVYVMDAGNDRIYSHRLDDSGNALLPDDESVLMTAKGQQIDNVPVGEMVGMTWMPTGGNRQTSDLVILSSSGLFEYNPNWGITSAALAGSDKLAAPVAVSSYFGNFYVLDSTTNSLLRYLPTTDGYNSPPQNYFAADQQVDLTNAVDMTIDGAVYILFRDGRIEKYLSGKATDFNLTGLDVPLNNPAAIYTASDETVQYIYVADVGNQRIVQLNKDGSFVRQFKPRAGEAITFGNVKDIYVDEIGGRIFILDDQGLYLGTIPEE